jgi:hypothetical protein
VFFLNIIGLVIAQTTPPTETRNSIFLHSNMVLPSEKVPIEAQIQETQTTANNEEVINSDSDENTTDSILQEELILAREMLQLNEPKKALKHLEKAEYSIQCPQRIVDKQVLASIWVYRGFAYKLLGKDDSKILDAWDQAFAMNLEVTFDEEVFLDQGAAERENILNYFEARRRMVEGFGGLDMGVPDQVGEAKLYVDGQAVMVGDVALPGKHLAQIVCPKDSLQSRWVTFEEQEAFEWFSLCPSGVDVSQHEEEEEMFPDFGRPSSVVDDVFNPDPICDQHKNKLTLPDISISISNPKEFTMVSMGGVLIASGAYTYLLKAKPAWEPIEEVQLALNNGSAVTITQEDANVLTREYNKWRFITLGLMGTGVVLTGYGSFSWLQVSPTSVGLQFQF